MSFYNNFVGEEECFGILRSFEMVFGTLVVNSTHVEFTPMEIETV